MHVRLGGGEVLGLTGEYMLVGVVEGQWKSAVEGFVVCAPAPATIKSIAMQMIDRISLPSVGGEPIGRGQ